MIVERSNDALTLALDTLEHTGRVRGMGMKATHTSFFHNPTEDPTSISTKSDWRFTEVVGRKVPKSRKDIPRNNGRDASKISKCCR